MKTNEQIRRETEEAIAEFRRIYGDKTSLTPQETVLLDALNEEYGYGYGEVK